jgi:hypothetical protein
VTAADFSSDAVAGKARLDELVGAGYLVRA